MAPPAHHHPAAPPAPAWLSPLAWAELFALSNIAFLAVDIYMAHSVNGFEDPTQWIPIVFSLAAPVLLLLGMALGGLRPAMASDPLARRRVGRAIGLLVGWGAIVVGIAGMIFHLRDHFFREQTLRNLVYTAPFIAPLSYTGIGLLLLLDRMVPATRREWARWVLVLALGGFIGNFGLSLADHAQNGFFDAREWIAVVAGAAGVGFLVAALLNDANRPFRILCYVVLALEAAVGALGFAFHLWADLHGQMGTLWDDLIYGAPIFAPLLFANIALLAAIGLVALDRDDRREAEAHPGPV